MASPPEKKGRAAKSPWERDLAELISHPPHPRDVLQALCAAHERYQVLCRLSDTPVILCQRPGRNGPTRLHQVNRAALDILGFSRQQLLGLSLEELADSPSEIAGLCGRMEPGRVESGVMRLRSADGSSLLVRFKCFVLEEEDQGQALMTFRPLREAVPPGSQQADRGSEGLALLDQEGVMRAVSPAFCAITGYQPPELLNRTPDFLYHGRSPQTGFFQRIWRDVLEKGAWSGEAPGRCKDGRECRQWLSLSLVQGPEGERQGYVMLLFDMEEQRSLSQPWTFFNQYDPLTRLPNRDLLADRLAQAMARAKRSNRVAALACLDVDNFRAVNDSLGHVAGDRLLQEVARRLQEVLREDDTVARLGADEFALVLNDVQDSDSALMVARRVLSRLAQPCTIECQELYPSASLGLSLFPTDGADFATLLKNAQTALHRAKEEGRGGVKLFTQALNAQVTRRLAVEGQLRRALQRGQFAVYYQPKVDLATGRVVGAEALVRWRHPQGGIMSPAEFIPVAEESGLIVPIGEWVLATACRWLQTWHRQGHRHLSVAVNISARQLLWQHDVVQMVDNVLFETGLEPSALELEVTESTVMHNVKAAIDTMAQLKEMGVRLAMDDFGTGYSSLNYLKQFPLDVLKIDRSFIQGVPHDPEDNAIVTGIISLARSLGLEVVAEGVEQAEQVCFLKEHQCLCMQGYLFSKPLPRREFEELIDQDRRLRMD